MPTPTPATASRTPGLGEQPATIVFVHGAWHGAWCWESWSAAAREDGFATATPTLPGHDRPGNGRRIWARMGSYVEHVRQLVEAIDGPVVLVGHSMGGYVTQRVMERPPQNLAGTVLLASVPRFGVFGATLRLLRTATASTLRGMLAFDLYRIVATVPQVRRAFFGPDAPEDVVRATHARLQSESYIAFLAMLTRPTRPTGALPVLVVAAEGDALFSVRSQRRLATAHGADLHLVAGGHDVMLDVRGPGAIAHILDWSRRTVAG